MTTQKTPTEEPTDSPARLKSGGTGAAARALDQQLPPSSRPASSRLVSVGIAAALAMAIWLVMAGVLDDNATTPGARADETPTAPQQELVDLETRRFDNRAEADRRRVENPKQERQLADPSAYRELQRLRNRAEADRRQIENLQEQ